MRRLLPCLLILITAASCGFLPPRSVRVDPRTEFPEARPLEGSEDLPGDAPATEADVRGAWLFRQNFPGSDPLFGNAQFLAVTLWIREDGTYDLVYQAFGGTRARDDPRLSGIDVRETGRYSVTGGRLALEPISTRAVEVRQGNRQRRTLRDEPRSFLTSIDRGYMHLAGPCASYQIEPICRESTEVWITLRSVSIGSPADLPVL